MKANDLLNKLLDIKGLQVENASCRNWYFSYDVELQKSTDEFGSVSFEFYVEEKGSTYPIANTEVKVYGKNKNKVIFINSKTKEEMPAKFTRKIVKSIDLVELFID